MMFGEYAPNVTSICTAFADIYRQDKNKWKLRNCLCVRKMGGGG
jgi:hypothetical protein